MNNMRKYFIMMKKQKVRIENYNVVGPQLCEGKKKKYAENIRKEMHSNVSSDYLWLADLWTALFHTFSFSKFPIINIYYNYKKK